MNNIYQEFIDLVNMTDDLIDDLSNSDSEYKDKYIKILKKNLEDVTNLKNLYFIEQRLKANPELADKKISEL